MAALVGDKTETDKLHLENWAKSAYASIELFIALSKRFPPGSVTLCTASNPLYCEADAAGPALLTIGVETVASPIRYMAPDQIDSQGYAHWSSETVDTFGNRLNFIAYLTPAGLGTEVPSPRFFPSFQKFQKPEAYNEAVPSLSGYVFVDNSLIANQVTHPESLAFEELWQSIGDAAAEWIGQLPVDAINKELFESYAGYIDQMAPYETDSPEKIRKYALIRRFANVERKVVSEAQQKWASSVLAGSFGSMIRRWRATESQYLDEVVRKQRSAQAYAAGMTFLSAASGAVAGMAAGSGDTTTVMQSMNTVSQVATSAQLAADQSSSFESSLTEQLQETIASFAEAQAGVVGPVGTGLDGQEKTAGEMRAKFKSLYEKQLVADKEKIRSASLSKVQTAISRLDSSSGSSSVATEGHSMSSADVSLRRRLDSILAEYAGAAESASRQRSMELFLKESEEFAFRHLSDSQIWAERALAALELDRPIDGWIAAWQLQMIARRGLGSDSNMKALEVLGDKGWISRVPDQVIATLLAMEKTKPDGSVRTLSHGLTLFRKDNEKSIIPGKIESTALILAPGKQRLVMVASIVVGEFTGEPKSSNTNALVELEFNGDPDDFSLGAETRYSETHEYQTGSLVGTQKNTVRATRVISANSNDVPGCLQKPKAISGQAVLIEEDWTMDSGSSRRSHYWLSVDSGKREACPRPQ